MPATHRTVLSAFLSIGSRFETAENNGISHFLEHMLYRGTAAHPSAHELALAFEREGGSLMATTSSETGTLEVDFPPQNLARVLPLFGEVFAAPLLTSIEIERGIVREEILEGLDDRGQSVASEDLIRALMFEGHTLGQPISGTLDRLMSFSVDALREHHHRHYCGTNAVFALAGPLDAEAGLDALERACRGLPRGEQPARIAPPPAAGPRRRCVFHRASQTEVTLGFRAPGFHSPDEPSMELLGRILDDGMATRLYHHLCDERGLCYEVSGGYESYADSGLLELAAETGHERVATVVEQLLAIVSDLKQKGPTETELAAAKQRHRWRLEGMLDSPLHVADFFLQEELSQTRRAPLERAAQLEQVTVEQVQDTARRWLGRENLGLVLVGFPKKSELARVDAAIRNFE